MSSSISLINQELGGSWTPPSTSDPRIINFAYYVMDYSVNMGLTNGIDAKETAIVNLQNLQNLLDQQIINYSTVLSDLETDNPTQPSSTDPDYTKEGKQLQQFWTTTFGNENPDNLFNSDGTFNYQTLLQQAPNSAFAQYITGLQSYYGSSYDVTQDSFFQRVKAIAEYLHGNTATGQIWVPSNNPPSFDPAGSPNNIADEIYTGGVNTLDIMVANYWLANGNQTTYPNSIAGPNYLTQMYNDSSSAEKTADGVSQQKTTALQQYSSSENSIVQAIQQCLTSSSEAISTMINAVVRQAG